MRSGEPFESTSESGNATSTSRSLLARVRENQSDAWDQLVVLYSPLIYYWCGKFELPEQDIPDVIQEVFKSVATNMSGFRKELPQDTFRGWLRTITRNKMLDHHRRPGRQPKAAGGTEAARRLAQFTTDSSIDSSADAPVHDALFYRALELIRKNFHDRTWQAFWRVVVDGQSPKDVAEELSMRPGTVRVAKSRVLQRLRQELGDLVEQA
ncbi:MAG: RNA polymerase subunit sigma-70 [Planctomycetaceae bacterium]|nr:RNA polymerase subunit sigma-70 [Planctomycetaceae bacterium]